MDELTARIRLARTPDGQRLGIPSGFMLTGEDAILRSENGRLVIEPVAASLPQVLDRLEDLDADWPEIEDPPPKEVRL